MPPVVEVLDGLFEFGDRAVDLFQAP